MSVISIINKFNKFSYRLLGIGLVDAWRQASYTKEASQKAQRLAQKKYLREAIIIVEKALALWSRTPGFWERWICKLLLGNLLDHLRQKLRQWREKVAQANKLLAQAQAVFSEDTGNPLVMEKISTALTLYQRCSQILMDKHIVDTIQEWEYELGRRKQFQMLCQQAESEVANYYFKKAMAAYRQAEKLYSTEEIKQGITGTAAQLEQEEIYDAALQTAKQAEIEGKLQGALRLVQAAYTKFPRADGRDFIHNLQQTIQGKHKFRQGLLAENQGNFSEAISLYESAKLLLPDVINCRMRLGAIAIKMQAWETALSHLEGLAGEQAAYLRGFAYAQQENLHIADREWQGLSAPVMTEQREILKILSERKRLLSLQNIELLVQANQLATANKASSEFLQTFGNYPLVDSNQTQHILPRLEAELWQGKNWKNIVEQVEKKWRLQPNLVTLHNWVVANYYYTQINPKNLAKLIIALSTALANLNHAPHLQDVPWLGKSVDFTSVSLALKKRLEAAIDSVKDTNINEYLNLRDRLRLELVSLKFMGEPCQLGMQINDIFITPGCYQDYISQWQVSVVNKITSREKILSCLYTPWGLSVAACLEGDRPRAIQLKPRYQPTASVEIFAHQFVAYHEGCYQLEQQNWRQAIIPLQQAKSEIKIQADWQNEIDRLCKLQRQNISEFAEHLDFAEFWYEILGSQSARSYLAEYKAEAIREQVAAEKISLDTALGQLQELQKIDAKNPIVLDLVSRIDFQQELTAIEKLLRTHQFEAVVQRAKRSSHERIRRIVAELFLDTLLRAVKNHDLAVEDIYRLGSWAYQLCPDEPDFQEIYRSLKLY
jgi:hypothetical protein